MNPIVKRLIGLLMFGIGIGIAFWLRNVYAAGGEITDKVIFFAPILILYGGISVIAPDVFLVRNEWATAPAGKKAINIVVLLVGVGIGLWLRFTVFAAWK